MARLCRARGGGKAPSGSTDRKHLRELIRKYGLDPRHKLDGDDEGPSDD